MLSEGGLEAQYFQFGLIQNILHTLVENCITKDLPLAFFGQQFVELY